MTHDVRLTDDQIETMLRRRSAEPYPGMVRDVLTATAGLHQQRRWGVGPMSPRLAVLLAAALLASLVLGGSLAAGVIRDLVDPVPTLLRPTWMGALRPDLASLPTIIMPKDDNGRYNAVDPVDATDEDIDITVIQADRNGRRWDLGIVGAPPPDGTIDATGRVIEYGVVLDDGHDGIADCLVGISSDPRESRGYRVWVTDLVSGVTREEVGPPYGYPIDFSHPDEQDGPPYAMRFFFLTGTLPCDFSTSRVGFYGWATTSIDGIIQSWDYAPDNAWFLRDVDR